MARVKGSASAIAFVNAEWTKEQSLEHRNPVTVPLHQ
jgi:hypothetical protein